MMTFDAAKSLLTPIPSAPIAYTLADVERVFGVTYNQQQRDALAAIPFSEVVLRASAGTHMLFPGFPLSLLDLRANRPNLFGGGGNWFAHDAQKFSRTPLPLRWHLLSTTPAPGSLKKNWAEQCNLLGPDDEVPSAATVAFATIVHFEATGQRLFEKVYVRVADTDADGDRVCVGVFGPNGFGVDSYWVGCRSDDLGLASARRVPT